MRMWNIDPKILCRKHLLAEHNELHKFLPSFHRGVRIEGRKTQITVLSMKARHDELACEMLVRRYKHNSPYLPNRQLIVQNYSLEYLVSFDSAFDLAKSTQILKSRCSECASRMAYAESESI